MTAFDALMPSGAGASVAAAGAVRPGGGSGGWRQAVEQAQARAWLRDRTLAAGHGREQPGSGLPASSAAPLAGPAIQTAVPFAGPRNGTLETPRIPGTDVSPTVAPRPPMNAAPAEAGLPVPWTAVAPPATAPVDPRGPVAFPAAAAGQGEVLRSARARKQSIHAESGEQGVSVWIRDVSLNSREARHLAAAIAASLGSGRRDIASLYLNGRPMVDGSQLSSPQSSE